jgi:hypothetical protein
MSTDRSPKTPPLGRREWMKQVAASAAATALVPSEALGALGAFSQPRAGLAPERPVGPERYPAEWTGHNRRLGEYHVAEGYPSFAPHPRYLGELRGSWSQIGRQYGEQAGDLIRMVYEGWCRELLPIQGTPDVMAAYLREQEAYYEALVPEALELMHGIADGAATELAASAFPHELDHFQKILMINSYFGLMGKPPGDGTQRTTTHG